MSRGLSVSRSAGASSQVLEHLTPVRQLSLGQLRRHDGVEGQ
jgi:hypothetical protein